MSRFKLLPFYCFLFTSLLGKDDSVDFAREVLPILSNKCYACHGPDTKEEKLVRLDLENLAKKDLGDTMQLIQVTWKKASYFSALLMMRIQCPQKILVRL